jgi:hypothetical protein
VRRVGVALRRTAPLVVTVPVVVTVRRVAVPFVLALRVVVLAVLVSGRLMLVRLSSRAVRAVLAGSVSDGAPVRGVVTTAERSAGREARRIRAARTGGGWWLGGRGLIAVSRCVRRRRGGRRRRRWCGRRRRGWRRSRGRGCRAARARRRSGACRARWPAAAAAGRRLGDRTTGGGRRRAPAGLPRSAGRGRRLGRSRRHTRGGRLALPRRRLVARRRRHDHPRCRWRAGVRARPRARGDRWETHGAGVEEQNRRTHSQQERDERDRHSASEYPRFARSATIVGRQRPGSPFRTVLPPIWPTNTRNEGRRQLGCVADFRCFRRIHRRGGLLGGEYVTERARPQSELLGAFGVPERLVRVDRIAERELGAIREVVLERSLERVFGRRRGSFRVA